MPADSFSLAGRRSPTPTFRRADAAAGLLITAEDRLAQVAAAVAVVLARQNQTPYVVVGCADSSLSGVRPVPLRLAPDTTSGELWTTIRRTIDGQGHDGPPESDAGGPTPAVVVADGDASGLDPAALRRLRRRLAPEDGLLLVVGEDSLDCDYPVDRWEPEAVRRMLDQVITAAAAASADPGGAVAELDIASGQERRDLLLLSESVRFDDDRCLHELFAEQAARHPDRTAVVSGKVELTYRRLDAAANRWANLLLERGVKAGDRVGLVLARSPEFIVAMLAVLKAGATYVPIDPGSPRDRQDRLVRAGRLRHIVTAGEPPQPFDGVDADVMDLADAVDVTGHCNAAAPAVDTDPSTPAYVLFTSGSTGEPKGVAVTHHSVVRLFSATRERFGFTPDDRWLNAHSVTFDASVWEIYGALLHGARVVIAPPQTARDPEEMVSLVQDEGVTMLTISPTAFDGFRDAALDRGTPFTALRFVVLCAEALNVEALRGWFQRWGDRRPRLVNMFGITETTVHSTIHDLTTADLWDGRCRLGRGLPDTPVHVLDDKLALAPFGVPGEIYVSGPGVSAGYFSAAPADHDRFMPDPYSPLPGTRMYRSGDRGRRLPDGTIEYLGRLDHQTKIRGFRIELGEVEAALHRHPDVRTARAWVVRRPDRPPLLAAAVVVEDRHSVEPEALRTFAADLLPEYMVPAGVVIVDKMPQTPNGKLAVHELPDPFATAEPGSHRPDDPPPGSALALVTEQMAAVLGLPEAAADTNFFRSGGDSITAARLVARLRRLGVGGGISLAHLYEHRTPRKLAALIDAPAAADTPPETTATHTRPPADDLPAGVLDAFPATRLQQGMFLHNVLDGEHVYHDVFSYTFDTALDEKAFTASARVTVAANPALRSSFAIDGENEARQLIHAEADVSTTFVDLRELPPEDRLPALEQWAEHERATPFPWTVPGLLRLFVHRLDDTVSVLSISVHHALVDGWSISLTITELITNYLAALAGKTPEPKPETGMLGRYAAMERLMEADTDQAAFWAGYLAGATPTQAPPTGDGGPAPAGEVRHVLPAELADRVRRAAAQAGVPVKTVYLAAHLAVLSFISGRSDVLTGVVTGGRPEEDGSDQVVGLFTNTLPLRLDVGDQPWRRLVDNVFEEETRLQRYRRFPLERIQAATGTARLCPVAFNYTDFHTYEALAVGPVRLRGITYREDVEFALLVSVHADPVEGSTAVAFKYQPGALSQEAVRRYVGYFADVVRQAVEDPEQPVLRSLAARLGDRHESAAVAAGPSREPGPGVWASVAGHVRDRPDAPAVVCGGRSWTYAEVADRVSAVRQALADLGVRRGQRVACLTEPGVDALVALLGTWAAGASYVPVDPGLPMQRRRSLLERAACSVMLRSAGIAWKDPAWRGDEMVLVDEPAPRRPVGEWLAPPPDSEAYVLFPVESAGDPTPVGVPHRVIENLVAWQTRQPEFAAARRVGHFAAPSSGAWIQELATTAAAGGTLVTVTEDIRRNPTELAALFEQARVEVAFLAPEVLRELAAVPAAPGSGPTALRSVIVPVTGAGEALVITDEARRLCRATGATIVHQHGSAETPVVTSYRLEGDPGNWPENPPIGRPIDNVTVRVLDTYGRPVPRNTVGELHVGGIAVAGCVPAASAQPGGPFVDIDGEQFRRTGDLVRIDGEELVFVGRRDGRPIVRDDRPEPTRAGLDATAETSPLEREVLAVWSQVLDHQVTDADVSFLKAGGSSLLLLRLYLQLCKTFPVEFPMRVLFRFPTARQFAQFITELGSPDPGSSPRVR